MKKILFHLSSITVSLSLLVSCEKSPASEFVEKEYFFKTYGTYLNEYASSIIQTPDSGLIWVGITTPLENPGHTALGFNAMPYICKVSPNGNIKWQYKGLEGYINSIAHDVAIRKQSPQIITSISQKINNDSIRLHILPMHLSGECDTSISLDFKAEFLNAATIIVAPTDSIRLLVQTGHRQGDKLASTLHLYSFSFSSGFKKTFEQFFSNGISEPVLAAYFSDENIIVAATIPEHESISGGTDVRIMNLTTKDMEWGKDFGQKGVSETASDLKILDGNIVVAGNINGSSDTVIHTLTVDSRGQSGEFTRYTTPNFHGINCASFDVNPKGNYVFTGCVCTAPGSSDAFFIEFTKSGGVVQDDDVYGPNGLEQGKYIGKKIMARKNSPGYFIIGQAGLVTNTDVSILKINNNGSWLD